MANDFGSAFTQSYENSARRYTDQQQRDIDNARNAVQDTQRAQEFKVKMGRERAVDSAAEDLRIRTDVGMRQQANINANDLDFDTALSATGKGLAMPAAKPMLPEFTPASRRQLLEGQRSLATAAQDYRALPGFNDSINKFDEDKLVSDAKVTPALVQYLNDNHNRITVGTPGKNGIRPMSFTKLDGSAAFLLLSGADQKALAGADALMFVNPERAMAMVGRVNKDLAATLKADNDGQFQVTGNGNANQFKALDQAETNRFHTNTERHQREMEKIAADRAGKAGREATEKQVTLTNGKESAVFVVDTSKRDSNGMIVMPPGWKPITQRPEYKQQDLEPIMDALRREPANKGLPYRSMRQMAIGVLTGQDNGGLEDVYGAGAGADAGKIGAGSQYGPAAPPAPPPYAPFVRNNMAGLPSRIPRPEQEPIAPYIRNNMAGMPARRD